MEFIDAPKISEVERIKQLGLNFKDVNFNLNILIKINFFEEEK